jgi:hypothetical protein
MKFLFFLCVALLFDKIAGQGDASSACGNVLQQGVYLNSKLIWMIVMMVQFQCAVSDVCNADNNFLPCSIRYYPPPVETHYVQCSDECCWGGRPSAVDICCRQPFGFGLGDIIYVCPRGYSCCDLAGSPCCPDATQQCGAPNVYNYQRRGCEWKPPPTVLSSHAPTTTSVMVPSTDDSVPNLPPSPDPSLSEVVSYKTLLEDDYKADKSVTAELDPVDESIKAKFEGALEKGETLVVELASNIKNIKFTLDNKLAVTFIVAGLVSSDVLAPIIGAVIIGRGLYSVYKDVKTLLYDPLKVKVTKVINDKISSLKDPFSMDTGDASTNSDSRRHRLLTSFASNKSIVHNSSVLGIFKLNTENLTFVLPMENGYFMLSEITFYNASGEHNHSPVQLKNLQNIQFSVNLTMSSSVPTVSPTLSFSSTATSGPPLPSTNLPTFNPTIFPTEFPAFTPSNQPSAIPTTSRPLLIPTVTPSKSPTSSPTKSSGPTLASTILPTFNPTAFPIKFPTLTPSDQTSAIPTTSRPSLIPTVTHSKSPIDSPTNSPTLSPSLKPSRNPTPRPSIPPTFTPTSLPTQIEGELTLQNINLSVLTTVEKGLLEDSLRDGIAGTVNVDLDAIKGLTLSDVVTSEAINAKLRAVTTLAESHNVLVSFTIVEESVNLMNHLQNSDSDCNDESNNVVQKFQAILACNNGDDFVTQFQTAVTAVITESGRPTSTFDNLVALANSVSVEGVSVIDKSPTFQPTSTPVGSQSNSNDSQRGNTNFYVIIIAAIASVVGVIILVAVVYLFNRSRKPATGVESDGYPKVNAEFSFDVSKYTESRFLDIDNAPNSYNEVSVASNVEESRL